MFYIILVLFGVFLSSKLILNLIKRVHVGPYELAFIYKNEKLIDILDNGKYFIFHPKRVHLVDMSKPFDLRIELNILLEFPIVNEYLDVFTVGDSQIGLLYKDGLYQNLLKAGRYAYWNLVNDYKIDLYETTGLEVDENFPINIIGKSNLYSTIETINILSEEIGILYVDGKQFKTLEPGVYNFWKNEKVLTFKRIDLRTQHLEIAGQEILTKDKAGIRVNFDIQYKVTDITKALVDNKDYLKQMYNSFQLALREYIGTLTLDNILANKEVVAPFILKRVKDRVEDIGITVVNCGIRDIILPGDIKDIMNQVLIAQKKAQANTIMRQEETASTRSLLNTAKLMDQNAMLYKLKELEYLERIAEKIGEITVSGGGKVLSELKTLFTAEKN